MLHVIIITTLVCVLVSFAHAAPVTSAEITQQIKLGVDGLPRLREMVLNLPEDENSFRLQAVRGIAAIGGEKACASLIDLLRTVKSMYVRLYIVDMLRSKFNSVTVRETLLQYITVPTLGEKILQEFQAMCVPEDKTIFDTVYTSIQSKQASEEITVLSLRLFATFHYTTARPIVLKYLDSRSSSLKNEAISLAGAIGDNDIKQKLWSILLDASTINTPYRDEAAEAIGNIGSMDDASRLTQLPREVNRHPDGQGDLLVRSIVESRNHIIVRNYEHKHAPIQLKTNHIDHGMVSISIALNGNNAVFISVNGIKQSITDRPDIEIQLPNGTYSITLSSIGKISKERLIKKSLSLEALCAPETLLDIYPDEVRFDNLQVQDSDVTDIQFNNALNDGPFDDVLHNITVAKPISTQLICTHATLFSWPRSGRDQTKIMTDNNTAISLNEIPRFATTNPLARRGYKIFDKSQFLYAHYYNLWRGDALLNGNVAGQIMKAWDGSYVFIILRCYT